MFRSACTGAHSFCPADPLLYFSQLKTFRLDFKSYFFAQTFSYLPSAKINE